jgi:hypothetical protein
MSTATPQTRLKLRTRRVVILAIIVVVISVGTWWIFHPRTTAERCFVINEGVITQYATTDNCPKSVVIPPTVRGVKVTAIGSTAFASHQLTSVTMPDAIERIGSRAFADNQLTSIRLPSALKAINNQAFANNQITRLTIPDATTHIRAEAFIYNPLIELTLGTNLSVIDHDAFVGNQLSEVIVRGDSLQRLQSSWDTSGLAGKPIVDDRSTAAGSSASGD